jgi:hypothetical protein
MVMLMQLTAREVDSSTKVAFGVVKLTDWSPWSTLRGYEKYNVQESLDRPSTILEKVEAPILSLGNCKDPPSFHASSAKCRTGWLLRRGKVCLFLTYQIDTTSTQIESNRAMRKPKNATVPMCLGTPG